MKSILTLFLALSFTVVFANDGVILIKRLGNGVDATITVRNAIQKLRAKKGNKLILEKGEYHFWPKMAEEKYLYISNNDHSLKSIAFDLSGLENVEVDGSGSTFIFHGYISPFLLEKSKNITVKNLSFDYARTFHSEGKIVNAYKDSLDLSFSKDFPYSVDNYRLNFKDKENNSYPFGHLLEFDAVKKEVAPFALDYINGVENLIAKQITPDLVRIYLPGLKGNVGNILVFESKNRLVPGIMISDSENISISHVTAYHAGGMGVIAQKSKNIFLDNFNVKAGEGRMVSLTADATHFANCSGKISIQNCVLQNQMDDAGNIHGVYAQIDSIKSDKEIIIKLAHFQQQGVDYFAVNDSVEFVIPKYLETYAKNSIVSLERINKTYIKVIFKNPLSSNVKAGDNLGVLSDSPDVIIKNCTIQKNRARGFLIGTKGKVLIENNYFHTWWGAIDLYANGTDWFEQGGVADLTIKGNIFDNCNYGLNVGLGVIIVLANMEFNPANPTYYNKNILIVNNTFKVFNPNILNMKSVDGLTFRKNKIEYTNTYKLPEWYATQKIEAFILQNSINIKIKK
jgi:hypothetical protein